MTRKHYVAIAAIIRRHLDSDAGSDAHDAVAGVAVALAGTFAADNQAFDRTRFLEACGVIA